MYYSSHVTKKVQIVDQGSHANKDDIVTLFVHFN